MADTTARKIVQITTLPQAPDMDPLVMALCDDGTVWEKRLVQKVDPWEQIIPIPQPSAPVYSPSEVAALVAAARDAVQRLNESGTGVGGLIDTIHAVAAILRPALSPFTDAPEADHG